MADTKKYMSDARAVKQQCLIELARKDLPDDIKLKYKTALDKAEVVLKMTKPRLVKKGKKHG